MTDIKTQIKHYSSQAVELSRQAAIASKERDFAKRQTRDETSIRSESKLSGLDSKVL